METCALDNTCSYIPTQFFGPIPIKNAHWSAGCFGVQNFSCIPATDGHRYKANTVPCSMCHPLFDGMETPYGVSPLGLCLGACVNDENNSVTSPNQPSPAGSIPIPGVLSGVMPHLSGLDSAKIDTAKLISVILVIMVAVLIIYLMF